MRENQKGRDIEISGSASIKHKMMAMSLYPGREITKLGHFALRGPVMIRLGRSVVALGHGVASKIIVEVE